MRELELGIAGDRPGAMLDTLRSAPAPLDLVVTTGGASVGTHDHVVDDLSSTGTELGFWKIAMRPGKPLIHGRVDGIPLLGLPGNPVSSAVCARGKKRVLRRDPEVVYALRTGALSSLGGRRSESRGGGRQ